MTDQIESLDSINQTEQPEAPKPAKKPRGFAAWTPEKRLEVSRKGGKSAHVQGTAHKWNAEQARAAGRLGGRATNAKRLAAEGKQSE
jgi:general stress protein YciG